MIGAVLLAVALLVSIGSAVVLANRIGHSDGYYEGHDDGVSEGHESAYAKGYDDGLADGCGE